MIMFMKNDHHYNGWSANSRGEDNIDDNENIGGEDDDRYIVDDEGCDKKQLGDTWLTTMRVTDGDDRITPTCQLLFSYQLITFC